MPISYPLLIPGAVGPARANLKKFDAVGEFIGPFDGSAQQQVFQDQHWELDLEWPDMTWPQFAPLDAFAGAVRGKLGSFLWGPPLATGPRGLGNLAGAPTATGVDFPLSNLLHTSAWLPNKSGILLPGDFLSLLPASFPFTSYNNLPGVVNLGAYGTLPTWAVVGANVWIVGTGLFDGGPFVLTYANQSPAGPGGSPPAAWAISFNNPAAVTGSGAIAGSVNSSPFPRLHQYVNSNALASDGGGNATLDIWPSIRETPPAGAPIVLINPQGTFRLAGNRREAPSMKTKTFTFQMKCREAI